MTEREYYFGKPHAGSNLRMTLCGVANSLICGGCCENFEANDELLAEGNVEDIETGWIETLDDFRPQGCYWDGDSTNERIDAIIATTRRHYGLEKIEASG
jgi:hypothetical protein